MSFFFPRGVVTIYLLSWQLLPKHCAVLISQLVHRKKKEKGKKNTPEMSKPGAESYRKTREELTT